ncbi:hypothetical protein F5880DRAFT_1628555, partial [Lentinula raphanica]
MSILVVVRPQRTRRSLTPTPDVHEDAPAPFASSPPMVSQERNDVTFQLLMSSCCPPATSFFGNTIWETLSVRGVSVANPELTSTVSAPPAPIPHQQKPCYDHSTFPPHLKSFSSLLPRKNAKVPPIQIKPLPPAFPQRHIASPLSIFSIPFSNGELSEALLLRVLYPVQPKILCFVVHSSFHHLARIGANSGQTSRTILSRNYTSIFTHATEPSTPSFQQSCPECSSTQAHEKNYHSVKHTVFYDGIKTTIHRREDGKLPCPCGSEVHARYNFQKWSNLNRQLPHPGSESSPYPDEPTTHDAAAPYPDSIQSRPEAFAAFPAPPLVETSQANQSLRATTHNPEESCQDDPSADVDMPPEPIPTLPQTPAETVAYLARFNIAVEPTCLLTICTECHSLVEHVHIQTHQRRLHFRGLNLPAENRLPSNAIIQSLLSSLGAHQPRPIPEGGIPCPPGVNTVQGYKCSIPGCPPMVYGAERTFRKHWSLHHPTLAVHDRHSTR